MNELQVRNSNAVFKVVLFIGAAGLVVAYFVSGARTSALVFVCQIAVLVGIAGLLDRRVKLHVSETGIRYAQWGPELIPWGQFSACRRVSWKSNAYVQLLPVMPETVLNSLSRGGKLNQRIAEMMGIPAFGIAVTPLEITEEELVNAIARYLPLMH